jgi:hypothetical protein
MQHQECPPSRNIAPTGFEAHRSAPLRAYANWPECPGRPANSCLDTWSQAPRCRPVRPACRGPRLCAADWRLHRLRRLDSFSHRRSCNYRLGQVLSGRPLNFASFLREQALCLYSRKWRIGLRSPLLLRLRRRRRIECREILTPLRRHGPDLRLAGPLTPSLVLARSRHKQRYRPRVQPTEGLGLRSDAEAR